MIFLQYKQLISYIFISQIFNLSGSLDLCGKTLSLFVTYSIRMNLKKKILFNFKMILKALCCSIVLFIFVVIAPLLALAKDTEVSELACFIEPYITVNLVAESQE